MFEKSAPKTEPSKRITSRSAAKRYLASRQMIVTGEKQEDLETLLIQWHDAYPSEDSIFARVVSEAGASQWLLRRAQRSHDQAMQRVYALPQDEWSEQTHAEFQRANRYLDAARRALIRDRNMIFEFLRE